MDPADDEHLSPDKQIDIAKKMYIGGFFFLPWLWLVNFLFYKEYMNKPNTPPIVKTYVYRSLAGFGIWTVVFFIWLSVYLVNHNSWGAGGDKIAVNIPKGV
ncbi:hypothetical protein PROFUN_03747 [Planoprotostelium fungivorum]|uniref:Gamma-secretase subunit PEN-2 n=1 Tax=Planoprotostelium fungivorum TaxID=1890364 RepID=A0A2P6NDM6_9EUKA|nr:hypothetical protein PROFUN_03747 [Planoprotostelium fungivorum]